MARDIHEQLTKYLTDAHSIEEQSLQQLRKAPDIADEAGLAGVLRAHLPETERHERRIRELLEARGASPSGGKDAIMRLGGEGFVRFAQVMPDTPGKLAAHALSYEALEWASYDLLARTARRAGEPEVERVATEIRDDERAVMDRIEEVFDGTVAASLRDVPRDDLPDQLITYLADAHAIEAQSAELLDSGLGMLEDRPQLARLFQEHLGETRGQQEQIEARLEALGGSPSKLKDAAMWLAGFQWSHFFQAHPDTSGKLMAFAFAFEHLEIGGYEQLRRVAERAGDDATVDLAVRILAEERAAAGRIAAAFEEAVDAALAEQTVR